MNKLIHGSKVFFKEYVSKAKELMHEKLNKMHTIHKDTVLFALRQGCFRAVCFEIRPGHN